jgi:hypothetical protein
MKNGLGSLAARDVSELAAIVRNRLKRSWYRAGLAGGFPARSGWPSKPNPP